MNAERRAELEARGYYVTTAAEWLGLSQAQSDRVEINLALSAFLGSVRERAGLSMRAAGRRVGLTEAQYRRLESGEGENAIGRMIEAALKLGVRYREIGLAIAEWPGDDSLPGPSPDTAHEERGIDGPRAATPAQARAA
jgi:transcriptional regulator with XRE-family HTH domain